MNPPSRTKGWMPWVLLLLVALGVAAWWGMTLPSAAMGQWAFDEAAYLQELAARNPTAAESFNQAGQGVPNPWMTNIVIGRRSIARLGTPSPPLFRVSYAVHHRYLNCDCPDIIVAGGSVAPLADGLPAQRRLGMELKEDSLRLRFDQQPLGVPYPYRRQ